MSERNKPRPDPLDGLPAMPVGEWARDKHALLKLYIEITRAARAKFVGPRKAGATFIDLFSGPGRAVVKATGEFVDGSPLVAWNASVKCGVPFSAVFLNDSNSSYVDAAFTRLARLNAPVTKFHDVAESVAQQLVRSLNRQGLHFALLDPFSLGEMPFTIVETLCQLERIDMLIHVSAMDLQRNWDQYSTHAQSPLDRFAPGWREHVNVKQSEEAGRLAFVAYWIGRLQQLGLQGDTRFELIKGTKGQPLYWLVLVAKHEIATAFWKKATQIGKTKEMFQ